MSAKDFMASALVSAWSMGMSLLAMALILGIVLVVILGAARFIMQALETEEEGEEA